MLGADYLFAYEPEPQREIEDIPFTLDMAIARFLTRWCHRALGDRAVAEQELRELIARSRSEARE